MEYTCVCVCVHVGVNTNNREYITSTHVMITILMIFFLAMPTLFG